MNPLRIAISRALYVHFEPRLGHFGAWAHPYDLLLNIPRGLGAGCDLTVTLGCETNQYTADEPVNTHRSTHKPPESNARHMIVNHGPPGGTPPPQIIALDSTSGPGHTPSALLGGIEPTDVALNINFKWPCGARRTALV